MASTAAWGRDEWASMEQSVVLRPRDNQDSAFYRAVQSVHRQDWRVREDRRRSLQEVATSISHPYHHWSPSPEPTSFLAQVVQQRRGQLPAQLSVGFLGRFST